MSEKNKVMLKATLSVKDDLTGSLGVPVERIYPDLEDVTIKPSTEEQKWKSKMYGYNEITVEPVTSEIDEDIQPENIKAGTNILGVEGAFVGIDTSDATAVSDDILEGKTAYTNNEKITGTISKYDGSYDGNADGGIVITDGYYLCYLGHRQEIAQQLVDMCGAITSANYMFYNCKELTKIDVSKLDTSQCTNMYGMFYHCEKITELDVSKWNTSKVTNMGSTFSYCRQIAKLDVSNFDTSNVTNMSQMFCTMSALTEIDVSNFDTSNVTDVGEIFMNDRAIVNLDLSNWDLGKVDYVRGMLGSMSGLTNLKSFKNLGKGYTRTTTNYSGYQFEHYNTAITKESLIDLITNGLYDLNLTYDVTNGGTLYRQKFSIGTTNMAKLTEEEIQIAIDKGWDIS